MTDRKIQRWCQQNNWTEPRKLENGIWVAFPPGGVMETPLPFQSDQSQAQLGSNRVQDVLDTILLLVVAVVVGTISLIIAPCFIAPIISRYKKRKSTNQNYP